MEAIIPDTTTDERMAGLELFLERFLGPRRAEFGEAEEEVGAVEMPEVLRRFYRFAGRWPGQNPRTGYVNRFCAQDSLCSIRGGSSGHRGPALQYMDGLLVFVWENQGVWAAATERAGVDPPVWINEAVREWRQLEKPLSHFLVSFVLQELMFGCRVLAAAPGALAKFEEAGMGAEPVWIKGEYAWDVRPSYFLAGERFLVRQAPEEADGDEWYGCNDEDGVEVLESLGLPTVIG